VLDLHVPRRHRAGHDQHPIQLSMPANASIGAPALTLGVIVRRTGPPSHAPSQPIPHSARGSLGCPISRGFVPWRLSDAGPGACGEALGGRHPKPITYKLETTALYTRIATNTIRAVMSPLDRLAPLMPKKDEPKDDPPA
jgi:hypothetical protein